MKYATTLFASLALLLVPMIGVAQPTIDGDISDADYIPLGTNVDAANGFGDTNNIDSLVYFPDEANQMLYIGVEGELETPATNGFGILLNVSGSNAPEGVSAGDPLGISGQTGFHFLTGNGGSNLDFAMDFEVDYALGIAPNNNDSETVAVAGSYTGDSPTPAALDTTDQSGTSISGTGPGGQDITFALNNSGDALKGAEFAIPFSEIGASADMNIEIFAVVVSGTAYFSNETIPGDATQISGSATDGAGNPGFDANWSQFAGGPYSISPRGLPVELASFDVTTDARDAVLSWTTASETNNAGFEVQHAVGEGDYQAVSFVEGAGTTTEPQSYRFRVGDLASGTHHFRLKQVDLDGTETLGPERTITVSLQQAVAFEPIAPNPAQGTASFSFATREAQDVTVTLFNVLGQQVATLYAGKTAPEQTQSVQIDTGDLTSGAYFVRVQGETFTETRRLTVLQ